MRIGLFTDAPKHNLALMKISAWHKAQGDEVTLNQPLGRYDLTCGSWLFDFNGHYPADINGGPGYDPLVRLPADIEAMKPDYSLYRVDYSLGSTWEYCPQRCGFCVVPKQNNPRVHRSIWDFHVPRFEVICLLNNNTFSDPQWRETFEEIWDANLIVRDENGYDLRLLNDEKAEALKRTRFKGQIHFAWDRLADEAQIRKGLDIARRWKLRATVYVLMGYDSSFDEDIYRCQVIHDYGLDPFPMLYRRTLALRRFRRFIYLRFYRQYPTLREAWEDYHSLRR